MTGVDGCMADAIFMDRVGSETVKLPVIVSECSYTGQDTECTNLALDVNVIAIDLLC